MQGELGTAERYLKRAISLSIDAAKEGVAGREERASDWIALMDLMSGMNPSSTRAADAVVCDALCICLVVRGCAWARMFVPWRDIVLH